MQITKYLTAFCNFHAYWFALSILLVVFTSVLWWFHVMHNCLPISFWTHIQLVVLNHKKWKIVAFHIS